MAQTGPTSRTTWSSGCCRRLAWRRPSPPRRRCGHCGPPVRVPRLVRALQQWWGDGGGDRHPPKPPSSQPAAEKRWGERGNAHSRVERDGVFFRFCPSSGNWMQNIWHVSMPDVIGLSDEIVSSPAAGARPVGGDEHRHGRTGPPAGAGRLGPQAGVGTRQAVVNTRSSKVSVSPQLKHFVCVAPPVIFVIPSD